MTTLPWSRKRVEAIPTITTTVVQPQIDELQFFNPFTGSPFGEPAELGTVTPEVGEVQTVNVAPAQDPAACQLRSMLDQLKCLKDIKVDWDSYGSEPPSHQAVNVAEALIWNAVGQCYGISGSKSVPYSILPLSGGGVQIEWHGNSDSIEVEIGARGEMSYLLTKNEASPARYREEHDNVPDGEILRLVASVLS
jgi:hypothetical protein